jgi:hypothetical protein
MLEGQWTRDTRINILTLLYGSGVVSSDTGFKGRVIESVFLCQPNQARDAQEQQQGPSSPLPPLIPIIPNILYTKNLSFSSQDAKQCFF